MIGVRTKRLLPYIGIPIIVAVYLALKLAEYNMVMILCDVTLICFGYAAAYSDLKTRKVPNKLVLAMLAAWAVIVSGYVVIDIEAAIRFLIQSLIGGAAAGGFFLFLYVVSRKGVGGGDVKLIAVIGLFLTFAKLMPMLFFSSLLAALISGGLLLTKRATLKSAIPLVPFLYVGVLIVILM